ARLNEHARRALQAPEVRAKLTGLYFDVSDGGEPAALATALREASARWGEVIRRHDLRLE
ncbi:MAG TPA: tripartite tricarboxylate transporter substrate binding protein, partial [Ramlibacter sp.]|nr:tripartite tricarboxylate transporter substrate binding protein [Ramlibacter sp.]